MAWTKISDTVYLSDKGNSYVKISRDVGMTSTGKTVLKNGSRISILK